MTFDPLKPRAALKQAKRIVVKVGSRSLVVEGENRFALIGNQLATLRTQGLEPVLVSSGAVALGRRRLGMSERPRGVDRLQAAAATGQSGLMRGYEDAFDPHGVSVAQVLLTHADLEDRDRYLNARRALAALIDLGVVPIVNENDSVSIGELAFTDNDQLAAMIANVVGADLLVLLTDVEGVLDHDGKRVSVVSEVGEVLPFVRPPQDDVGLGGMQSKIEAARRGSLHGVPVVIGDARDGELLRHILAGEDVGTLFLPAGAPLASRKHWIAYTLKPRGAIIVDDGAARVIRRGRVSLLPSGVIGVRGSFDVGDAITIVDAAGEDLARGLSRYDVAAVARLAGARSDEIAERLGRHNGDVVVHKDDLVVFRD